MKRSMGGTETKTATESITAGAREIIERAAKHHISVIHLEPGPRFALVRYRRGGLLYVANKLPASAAKQLAEYFKAQADLDLDQSAAPQTGLFGLKLGRRTYEVEIGTMPVLHGEKITLSLNEMPKAPLSLEELGLWGVALNDVKRVLTQPHGLIVVGSRSVNGLNLTLAALIKALESPALKIAFISNENVSLPSTVKKVLIKPEIGFTEATQLSILNKENFDVFGISVINDIKTGQIIGGLAANHLVLGGVSVEDASSALARLEHLGIELIDFSPLPIGLGQTFVHCLCEHCREAYQPSTIERRQLDILFQTNQAKAMKYIHGLEQAALNSGLGKGLPLATNTTTISKLYRAKPHGCAHCDHTGYSGQIGLFEVLKPGIQAQKSLLAKATASQLEQSAIKDGMINLKTDGLIKALRGVIDLPTVLSVTSYNYLNF